MTKTFRHVRCRKVSYRCSLKDWRAKRKGHRDVSEGIDESFYTFHVFRSNKVDSEDAGSRRTAMSVASSRE